MDFLLVNGQLKRPLMSKYLMLFRGFFIYSFDTTPDLMIKITPLFKNNSTTNSQSIFFELPPLRRGNININNYRGFRNG